MLDLFVEYDDSFGIPRKLENLILREGYFVLCYRASVVDFEVSEIEQE